MNLQEIFAELPWLPWGLGLILGFPLAVVLLSEILHRLEANGRAMAGPVRHLRNITLPLLAVQVFMQQLMGLADDDTAIKVMDTLVFTSLLIFLLSFGNVWLFAEASANSWRANVPKLFLDLTRAFFIIIGLGMISGMVWEADLKAFFTALGVGSVVIGLALQDTLGNLFSGVALLFEKPFVIGDMIRVGELEGIVTEMTWRATWIRVTKSNALLVIPNLSIAKEQVLNLSKLGPHVVRVCVNFSPDDPPNRVKQALFSTISTVPGVLPNVPIEVVTDKFGEFALVYEVAFGVTHYRARWDVLDEFRSRLWYVARREGLTLEFPETEGMHRSHAHSHQTIQAPTQSPDAVYAKLALIPTLQSVPEEELRELAANSQLQNFAKQEIVIHEGDTSTPLYLVIEGEVLLTTLDRRGLEREVARLGLGEYIGLLQVMLGQPSMVTVQAFTDLLLLTVPVDAANRLLDRSPHLARDLGQSLESRRQTILLAKEGRTVRPQNQTLPPTSNRKTP